MKIQITASTKPNYTLKTTDAIEFSGKMSGICYLNKPTDELLAEDPSRSVGRALKNAQMGHHSVFGHVYYTLVLEDIPKILAMVLNNEQVYNTSEKSARYTKMALTGPEKRLYDKWLSKLKKLIAAEYPDLSDKKVEMLAQENARYFISVFAPTTTMAYTVDLRQLDYLMGWMEKYLECPEDSEFYAQLCSVFSEFLKQLQPFKVEGLQSDHKRDSFSLFASRGRQEEFGENYSVNYSMSLAGLAQAQRHRTLSYEMSFLDGKTMFYTPLIVTKNHLKPEWLEDMNSIKDLYPQGMIVQINERGTAENFYLKCRERLCGAAQLEIMESTLMTLRRYVIAVPENSPVYQLLEPLTIAPRCVTGWQCQSPCPFGKDAFERLV